IAKDLETSDSAEAKAMAEMLSTLPNHDKSFAEALAKTSSVLGFAVAPESNAVRPPVKSGLAFVGVEPTQVLVPFRGTITSLPALTDGVAGVGGLNLSSRDQAGIVRRIPMLFSDGEQIYPGLAAEALRVAQQQKGITVR